MKDFNVEDEVVLDGREVYVVEKIEHEGKKFIYVQEIEDDALVEKFYIYELGETPTVVTDSQLLETLLKKFVDKINEELYGG